MGFLGTLGSLLSANPISAISMGVGALGSLFGSDAEMTDEQRQTYESLLKRSKGLDPKLLALMRARMRGSVGSEFAGASANRMAQLRRQNAPNVIQRQEFEKLSTRRAGATSDALLGVDQLNENVKGQALGQMAGFTGRFPQTPGSGQGFASMFGAGFQGLMQNQGGNSNFLEELTRMRRVGDKFNEFDFGNAQVPSPYDMFRQSNRRV
jgi:hypothetical protein